MLLNKIDKYKCGTTREELYPRHPYLQTGGGLLKYGFVDNINPGIDDIFALIDQRSSYRELTGFMQIPIWYPG